MDLDLNSKKNTETGSASCQKQSLDLEKVVKSVLKLMVKMPFFLLVYTESCAESTWQIIPVE
jgi:hypothetical protein